MKTRADQAQLRNFGLIVGGIFGAIGLWPALIRGGNVRAWMVGLAIVLILPALVAPRTLAPAQRAFDSNATTYRVPRRPRPGAHMMKQF